MNFLEIKRQPEPKQLIGKRVQESDCTNEVRAPVSIYIDGKLALVYGKLSRDYSSVVGILRATKFSSNRRLTQYLNKKDLEVISTVDRNFGFNPPNAVFNNAAGPCTFNREHPTWFAHLAGLGEELQETYEKFHPEQFETHRRYVDLNIRPEWRMGKTIFTQGVMNDANALGYHFDRDNIVGGWSAMAYFTQRCTGGNLIIPSLGIKLMCESDTFMLFDGENLIHGVTPIRLPTSLSYRYSIVYYTRESMAGLGSMGDELERTRRSELQKHLNRAKKRKEE